MVGTMTCGNSKGLLVPHTTTEHELEHIKRKLPKDIKVEKINDVFTALGNCIACNDSVALIHPEMSEDTEKIIAETLQVTVIRSTIAGNPLVGTYCHISNNAMLVHPSCGLSGIQRLVDLTKVPVCSGTINKGEGYVGSGLVANDSCAFVGQISTATEISIIDALFRFNETKDDNAIPFEWD